MNPFLVFDLDRDATDEEVEARYYELLREHPPDRNPEAFALVRGAFESLRNRRCRLRAWLFSFDQHGRALAQTGPRLFGSRSRERIDARDLAAVMRSTNDGGEP